MPRETTQRRRGHRFQGSPIPNERLSRPPRRAVFAQQALPENTVNAASNLAAALGLATQGLQGGLDLYGQIAQRRAGQDRLAGQTDALLGEDQQDDASEAYIIAFLRSKTARDVEQLEADLTGEVEAFIDGTPLATSEDVDAIIESRFSELLLDENGDIGDFGSDRTTQDLLNTLSGIRSRLLTSAREKITDRVEQDFAQQQLDRLRLGYAKTGALDISRLIQEIPGRESRSRVAEALLPEAIGIATTAGDTDALSNLLDARFKDGVLIFNAQQRQTIRNAMAQADNVREEIDKDRREALANQFRVESLLSMSKGVDQTEQTLRAAVAGVLTAEEANTWLGVQDRMQDRLEENEVDWSEVSRLKSMVAVSEQTDDAKNLEILQAASGGLLGSGETLAGNLEDLFEDVRRAADQRRAELRDPTVGWNADRIKQSFKPLKGFDGNENREQLLLRSEALDQFHAQVEQGADPRETANGVLRDFAERFEAAGNQAPAEESESGQTGNAADELSEIDRELRLIDERLQE